MAPPGKSKANPKNKTAAPQKKKKTPLQPKSKTVPQSLDPSPSHISLELQQLLLNIFLSGFPTRLSDIADLQVLLQEVKGHLYNRDFLTAFGKEEYLEAYAVRWSPARALCYLKIYYDLFLDRDSSISSSEAAPKSEDGAGQSTKKIIALGGGAGAEIVALAAVQRLLYPQLSNSSPEETKNESPGLLDVAKFSVHAIDIASWDPITSALHTAVTTPPPLSKYASASARSNNRPLTSPSHFATTFTQADVLAMSVEEMIKVFSLCHSSPPSKEEKGDSEENEERQRDQAPSLITLMFTLNELLATSPSLTISFLRNLTTTTKEGTLLLIVDSSGSYSTISLASKRPESKTSESESQVSSADGNEKEGKQYPMHFLLDHILLGSSTAGKEKRDAEQTDKKWEKLRSEESVWFRLPSTADGSWTAGLKYPIKLEDMRYQLHLYRKCG
ncbi:hypothetical protein K402DRAFT_457332 [Aulographum hederae CBS 113979]|uniref:25S rRNA (Uridine(2843)-N(3))-methyltransferase n=1 Tax=Aulographum hederae CBS 113979 TaxID=1176131 RepID=A0A6G1GNF2_9PEZI|nr:hypothetical protein K402DRAFT_457332 [Aulographum hederae CBS 113979]